MKPAQPGDGLGDLAGGVLQDPSEPIACSIGASIL